MSPSIRRPPELVEAFVALRVAAEFVQTADDRQAVVRPVQRVVV